MPAASPKSNVLPAPPTSSALLPPPPPGSRVPLPGGGVLYALPGDGDLLALTLDDGVNSEVVRLYKQFAKDTGVRLTYFVNGVNDSWTVTHVYGTLVDLIRSRALRTVTLNDVFLR